MGKKFNPKNKEKLKSELRKKLLPAKETLEKLSLNSGDIMADIGCGIGYFSFPAAEIVGSGKVYAIDISEEMLEEVKNEIAIKDIKNIETIKSRENQIPLDNNTATYTFASTVLHEVDNINKFLKEMIRITVSNGKLVIVEWKKKESKFGPPMGHRLSEDHVKKALEENGLKDVEITQLGDELYGVIGITK